jgi:hypothetical protein
LHGDAGQAFQNVGHVVVAVFIQFFAAVHLFGHLCAAAQVVVGRLFSHDLDPFQLAARLAGGGLRPARRRNILCPSLSDGTCTKPNQGSNTDQGATTSFFHQ